MRTKQTVNERIALLREEMKKEGLSAYIIPSADPHQSEYVADYYKSRAYISGFTGSAGTVVITLTDSCLWTDGRYFIQAEQQISHSDMVLYKMRIPGVPTYQEWLRDHMESGQRIGFDQRLFSVNDVKDLQEVIANDSITCVGDFDLMSRIWTDRPPLPKATIFYHDIAYTGQSAEEKIQAIRQVMTEKKADVYLMSSLNDIAWLFNIRGGDIAYTPVTYAYAMLTQDEAVLYLQLEKLPESVRLCLEEQAVVIRPYDQILDDIRETTENTWVIYDPSKLNNALRMKVHPSSHLIETHDPVMMMKAQLNETEIKNLKNCQIKDGVALVRFLYWLEKAVATEHVTEMTAAEQLSAFRKQQALYIEDSFDTISAYKGNAAMMHYKAEEETAKVLEPRGLYLVDSGGQYYDGTTDITRTIVLGDITEEERRDFTLVLKAHIALNRLVFLHGATGTHIDSIARQPMWQAYMDYKCGTGHSVGYLSGVHEGPASIHMRMQDIVLEEGMLLTNEPGVYKENKHGIRIENDMLVTEVAKNDDGRFMAFDVISYCPIDLKGIDVSMLTTEEKTWLNNYHQEVYDKLSAYLTTDEQKWLATQTRYLP
ncbi:aminopeptidase P family protein [Vallitalea pronyensis]|uniref:Aminopeptidase P family protein n=1 Tax=Vallitalea pronyensis TaxID=1348613 RepID=A0A8J8MPL2_9FIRM|nr:aminopeptidase P family protein [Vallitalea pronyensis]QUI25053.1 aminopeptidase P family protein [Vallitalea pronyensis]